ncbi:MAG: hypothetical protein KDA78_07585 [Planctomycetaceae bacterium]|nr:hypothetical protein [Planctomycetaceae bacterium]
MPLVFRAGHVIAWLMLSAFCWLCFAGCQTTMESLLPFGDSQASFEVAEQHRQRFQETRHPDEIRWLLRNHVHNGMSRAEVDGVLGEDGNREFNDTKFLDEGGLYRSDDIAYRWGPDRDGNVYILVFRDDHLINFDNFSEQWNETISTLESR